MTIALLLPVILVAIVLFANRQPGFLFSDANVLGDKADLSPTETPNPKSPDNASPAMQIDPEKQYLALLETNYGEIEINLNSQATPLTVNNFVYLSHKGFYDQTIFHRIIKDFMIQGGDPTGTGSGGPGYRFADEPFTGEYLRGTIAMANAGPNTNGSQFFIMHQDYQLSPNYVIFGQVQKGLEVIDQIASVPVQDSGHGEISQPIKPVILKKVTISEN